MIEEDYGLNMDFHKMTIADVEALVRAKAVSVEVRNRWICITFAYSEVKIRKW